MTPYFPTTRMLNFVVMYLLRMCEVNVATGQEVVLINYADKCTRSYTMFPVSFEKVLFVSPPAMELRAVLSSFVVVVAMVSSSQPLQHREEHHRCVHDEVTTLQI